MGPTTKTRGLGEHRFSTISSHTETLTKCGGERWRTELAEHRGLDMREEVLEMYRLGDSLLSGTWKAAYADHEHVDTGIKELRDTQTQEDRNTCWITECPVYAKSQGHTEIGTN